MTTNGRSKKVLCLVCLSFHVKGTQACLPRGVHGSKLEALQDLRLELAVQTLEVERAITAETIRLANLPGLDEVISLADCARILDLDESTIKRRWKALGLQKSEHKGIDRVGFKRSSIAKYLASMRGSR